MSIMLVMVRWEAKTSAMLALPGLLAYLEKYLVNERPHLKQKVGSF